MQWLLMGFDFGFGFSYQILYQVFQWSQWSQTFKIQGFQFDTRIFVEKIEMFKILKDLVGTW